MIIPFSGLEIEFGFAVVSTSGDVEMAAASYEIYTAFSPIFDLEAEAVFTEKGNGFVDCIFW
jgi:hypothetical protein